MTNTLTLNKLTDMISAIHPDLDTQSKGLMLAEMITNIDRTTAKPEVKPIHTPAPRAARKAKQVDDWKTEPAFNGGKQHIRLVAAQLVIMDIGWTDVTDCYWPSVAGMTKGEVSDEYGVLKNYLDSVDGVDIRQGSAYWTEAASLLA